MNEIDDFTQGYIDCALWSSTDEDGEPLDKLYSVNELAPEALSQMQADCAQFQQDNAADLAEASTRHTTREWTIAEQHGHDFWLARNGHGAGFWDRGYGEVGLRLTKASNVWGSSDLYVGDDGLVYVS